jgi:dephospho-CoA kinase
VIAETIAPPRARDFLNHAHRDEHMYVGITGTFAAGKGEVVRILKAKGFVHYGFGDLLREQMQAAGVPIDIPHTTQFANDLRRAHGPDYLAKELLHKLERDAPEDAVLESIRTLGELAVLRKLPGFILVSVDAPRELRYERMHARGRKDNLNTFEEFCHWEDKQLEGSAHEQQLLAVMDEADVSVVNIGNLEELREQIEENLGI